MAQDINSYSIEFYALIQHRMIHGIINKLSYLKEIYDRREECLLFSKGHQVKLYNWSKPVPYDMWLIDFIEKRDLLKNKPDLRVGLYSIFAPSWTMMFDRCDMRVFVERENLHKPRMRGWLHRYLDDQRVQLSLGFDELSHSKYMHFPFYVMWSVFPPTASHKEIHDLVGQMNNTDNHSYKDRKFCSFVCSHDDFGRKKIFEQLSEIENLDCDGKLFHNNDDLKMLYNDDKLEYLKHYRFNLTPENSNYEGYVTEKLFEAIYCGCVPIYHGGNNHPEPDVLNQDAIIFVEMGKENEAAIRLVSELNGDENKYMDFACQPRFVDGAADVIWGYYETLETKLREMIANL